jgi:hypothetical protein
LSGPAVARGGHRLKRTFQTLAGRAITVLVVAAGLASASAGCHGGSASAVDVTAADLDRDVFTPNCAFGACHGGGAPAAGLDFSHGLCAAMLQRPSCLFPDRQIAVPGDPDMSFLMHKLLGTDLPDRPATGCGLSDARMPLGGTPLPAAQISRVRGWIMAGAPCDVDVRVADDAGADADGAAADGGAGDGGDLPPGGAQTLAFTPPTLRLVAGERSTITLTLSPPAGGDGATVVVDTSDHDSLAVPAAVFVPAGGAEVSFDVIGKRPAAAQQLTATLADASAAAAISIDGLYLGEIFYGGDGGSAHAQWVKLINASSAPIDLSTYVFAGGSAGYGDTVAALTGVLEAGQCRVVGGPDSTPDNGSPVYDQVLDFSPDIPQPTGDVSVGVGLFSAPAGGAGAASAGAAVNTAVPIDAVVVGADNGANFLASDGMQASPAIGSVTSGSSLARQAIDAWIVRAAPAPADCPTLE